MGRNGRRGELTIELAELDIEPREVNVPLSALVLALANLTIEVGTPDREPAGLAIELPDLNIELAELKIKSRGGNADGRAAKTPDLQVAYFQ